MPELPDVTIYVERLRALARGQPLERINITSPFALRTVDPPPDVFYGRILEDVRRMGKRIVLEFQGDLFMVFHLMIAGRLRWLPRETTLPKTAFPKRQSLARFDFPTELLFSRKPAPSTVLRCTWYLDQGPLPSSGAAASTSFKPHRMPLAPHCGGGIELSNGP